MLLKDRETWDSLVIGQVYELTIEHGGLKVGLRGSLEAKYEDRSAFILDNVYIETPMKYIKSIRRI